MSKIDSKEAIIILKVHGRETKTRNLEYCKERSISHSVLSSRRLFQQQWSVNIDFKGCSAVYFVVEINPPRPFIDTALSHNNLLQNVSLVDVAANACIEYQFVYVARKMGHKFSVLSREERKSVLWQCDQECFYCQCPLTKENTCFDTLRTKDKYVQELQLASDKNRSFG